MPVLQQDGEARSATLDPQDDCACVGEHDDGEQDDGGQDGQGGAAAAAQPVGVFSTPPVNRARPAVPNAPPRMPPLVRRHTVVNSPFGDRPAGAQEPFGDVLAGAEEPPAAPAALAASAALAAPASPAARTPARALQSPGEPPAPQKRARGIDSASSAGGTALAKRGRLFPLEEEGLPDAEAHPGSAAGAAESGVDAETAEAGVDAETAKAAAAAAAAAVTAADAAAAAAAADAAARGAVEAAVVRVSAAVAAASAPVTADQKTDIVDAVAHLRAAVALIGDESQVPPEVLQQLNAASQALDVLAAGPGLSMPLS